MIATYTAPSARSADGSIVITFFAASIVAVKAIVVPPSAVVGLQRQDGRPGRRSVSAAADGVLAQRLAEAERDVPRRVGRRRTVPLAGLNTGPATLVSTVNVADAATPLVAVRVEVAVRDCHVHRALGQVRRRVDRDDALGRRRSSP